MKNFFNYLIMVLAGATPYVDAQGSIPTCAVSLKISLAYSVF